MAGLAKHPTDLATLAAAKQRCVGFTGPAGSTAHPAGRTGLVSALADAVAGDQILLADGIYDGDYTLSQDKGTDAKVVVRSRNSFGAKFPGRIVSIAGRGYWFYELEFTGHFGTGDSSLIAGSFQNITRCRFLGRNGIRLVNGTTAFDNSPVAPKRDVNIGWCDFVGRNDAAAPTAFIKIQKNDDPPAGQIEFQNINIYDCYFNDPSTGNDSQQSENCHCIYLGNTQIDPDVPQFPNFNILRCYFSPDCRRKRAIYLKHGITQVRRCRSGLKIQGVAFCQRHGFGTKWYANVAEDTVGGSGFIFGGGGTAELFIDVRGNQILGRGRFRVENGWATTPRPPSRPSAHQAAHHILFVGNSGLIKLGTSTTRLSEGGRINNARIYQHTGGISPAPHILAQTAPVGTTLVDTASLKIEEDGNPLNFEIPSRITLTPEMVGLELDGER